MGRPMERLRLPKWIWNWARNDSSGWISPRSLSALSCSGPMILSRSSLRIWMADRMRAIWASCSATSAWWRAQLCSVALSI